MKNRTDQFKRTNTVKSLLHEFLAQQVMPLEVRRAFEQAVPFESFALFVVKLRFSG